MTKEIQLTRGYVAIVDDQDYEQVVKHNWYAQENEKKVYAISHFNGKRIWLHRFILNAPPNMMVDHKDGDGLNCQRGNIRTCTNAQNQHNTALSSKNTSGYKGVYWNKLNKNWCSLIRSCGKKLWIGAFDTKEDAARAYDKRAIELRGDFAKPNFPIGDSK